MFREWGFLLTEIWLLLALAALVGLIAGWIIWGGNRPAEPAGQETDPGELDALRARARAAEEQLAEASRLPAPGGIANPEAMARLRDQLDACHDARSAAEARISELEGDSSVEMVTVRGYAPQAAAKASSEVAPSAILDPENLPRDSDGFVSVGQRPKGLPEPRGGVPDDLKLIRGVGPKLEELNNSLGYWHFDQIANWTPEEVAWVDHNLGAFNGRVTRDDWIGQAKAFTEGDRS